MTKNYTIKDISEGLAKKEFSAEEILSHYSNKIGLENKKLNAYLSTLDFQNSKFKIQNSSLAGVPAAIKDNMLIDGTVATAGSKILENYTSAYDATVIDKLKKAGVQFLGKTNMDEFAMGSSVENSAFGPTKNPHDLERVPGGSSGGSAAAVAADLCVFALGSDTGGSIRQPASFCGVVGLKPTYGAVSRSGVMAMASSLDQIGPFAKTVEDAKIVFDAIRGKDPKDATSMETKIRNSKFEIRNLRIGVPKEYFGGGIDKGVKASVEAAIADMQKARAKIIDISLPHTKYAIAAYYIIMPAEVSSNLARYDGIKYGHSAYHDNAHDTLETVYRNSRSAGFGKEVQRRIMLGTYVLSAGYYDAYYKKAQQVRTQIRADFEKAFKQVDVIATPTCPTTAFRFGEKTTDPLAMYLEDVFTVPVNLAGLPALSMPCAPSKGLPVGLQLIAPWFGEEILFSVGAQLEHASE